MALSKLHVRFIQTQKNFYLKQGSNVVKLPLAQLYVKDTNNFYLVLTNEEAMGDNSSITFKEKTPALNTLTCKFKVNKLDNDSEDYEDALLFFQVDESKVKQVLLLNLEDLSDS